MCPVCLLRKSFMETHVGRPSRRFEQDVVETAAREARMDCWGVASVLSLFGLHDEAEDSPPSYMGDRAP